MSYAIYILGLSNGQYYVGSTSNLKRRLVEHENGRDNFTKKYLPVKLLYYEEYPSREEAWKREKQLHGWSRIKKEKLISGEWKGPDWRLP